MADYDYALLHACSGGNVRRAIRLINRGVEVETQDYDGRSGLIHAAINGHLAIINMLLNKGANIEAADHEGRNALMHASEYGHNEIITILLDKGANPEAKDIVSGVNALMIASQAGRIETASILLDRGARIHAVSDLEMNALMVACAHSHLDVIAMLIDRGANIEAMDSIGWTALFFTAFCNLFEVAELLVSKGADLYVELDEGITALTMYGLGLDIPAELRPHDPRPALTNEEKKERCDALVRASDAFILAARQEANWERRFPFVHMLVGSGFRPLAAAVRDENAAQLLVDTSASIPPIAIDTSEKKRTMQLHRVFGHRGLHEKIASYI